MSNEIMNTVTNACISKVKDFNLGPANVGPLKIRESPKYKYYFPVCYLEGFELFQLFRPLLFP